MSKILNWKATPEDATLIDKIVDRGVKLARQHGVQGVIGGRLSMDITACHLNCQELDLKALLEARDSDFAHDVFGIRNYIDRSNGQLTDCFHPRYSKKD